MTREMLIYTFKNIPTLTTERLVLRKLLVSDASDMFEYACREQTCRYLFWSPHKNIAHTKEYLKFINGRYRAGDFYDWAITLRENGKMIGTCGFTNINTTHRVGEIGYVISPDYHRQGIAAEAAAAVIKFGFEELDLSRIEVRFIKENEASLKVAKKLGMTLEGYLRNNICVKGTQRTVGISSILKSEYTKNAHP